MSFVIVGFHHRKYDHRTGIDAESFTLDHLGNANAHGFNVRAGDYFTDEGRGGLRDLGLPLTSILYLDAHTVKVGAQVEPVDISLLFSVKPSQTHMVHLGTTATPLTAPDLDYAALAKEAFSWVRDVNKFLKEYKAKNS